jgi:hypothetical protein
MKNSKVPDDFQANSDERQVVYVSHLNNSNSIQVLYTNLARLMLKVLN